MFPSHWSQAMHAASASDSKRHSVLDREPCPKNYTCRVLIEQSWIALQSSPYKTSYVLQLANNHLNPKSDQGALDHLETVSFEWDSQAVTVIAGATKSHTQHLLWKSLEVRREMRRRFWVGHFYFLFSPTLFPGQMSCWKAWRASARVSTFRGKLLMQFSALKALLNCQATFASQPV